MASIRFAFITFPSQNQGVRLPKRTTRIGPKRRQRPQVPRPRIVVLRPRVKGSPWLYQIRVKNVTLYERSRERFRAGIEQLMPTVPETLLEI